MGTILHGTLINATPIGAWAEGSGDEYIWDTSALTTGSSYYVYAFLSACDPGQRNLLCSTLFFFHCSIADRDAGFPEESSLTVDLS